MKPKQFSYTPDPVLSMGMPLVDIMLSHNNRSILASALIDSGSALNILPFDAGTELGLKWEKQTFPLDFGGILKGAQGYAVILSGEIAPFTSLELGFAWVNKPSTEVRVILGQVNFFQEFNVYFYGHQQTFDIVPRSYYYPLS